MNYIVAPADDAPDIVANTFLATLSEETPKKIRYGFLEHRECEWNLVYPMILKPELRNSQVSYQWPSCMDDDECEWKPG